MNLIISKYYLQENPEFTIELRDPERNLWAVCKNCFCLNNDDLEFEYEPQPSSRNLEFFMRTRFPLNKAMDLLAQYIEKRKKGT
jgi:hypothetical protein